MKITNYILIACCLLLVAITPAHAFETSNDSYNINDADFRKLPNQAFSTPTPTPTSVPQKIMTTETNNSFIHISIDPILIDFGPLTATTPVIRTANLKTIGDNYYLKAYEEQKLKSGNQLIPDTTCDDGVCNEARSSIWKNNLTYGFGYRLPNFENDSFRQFSDISEGDNPVNLLDNKLLQNIFQTKIIYKLNIQGTQKEGIYSNNLIYMAIPRY